MTKPTWRSDLLGPLVTTRAIELARHRLINHRARIDRAPDDTGTKRIALILVREMNPVAAFTNAEEGILRGLDADTVGRMKTRGEM